MATNLSIDGDLLDEAKRAGGHRTKREAVNQALREYVRRRKLLGALDLFGRIDFDPVYDHKALRRKR